VKLEPSFLNEMAQCFAKEAMASEWGKGALAPSVRKGCFLSSEWENFSKKGCFLSFKWEKTNFTTFGPP